MFHDPRSVSFTASSQQAVDAFEASVGEFMAAPSWKLYSAALERCGEPRHAALERERARSVAAH